MALQKKDFIEVNFTGKTKDGNVFDSNLKENLEKLNSNAPAKPLVFCLGEGMFLKAIDDFLIGKETGKYTIELTPENSFGKRMSEMIQRVPTKVFKSNNLNPFPGAVFNFDGQVAKVLSVSGGRVLVDFNNPLAGKDVIYEIEVTKKVEDIKDKIKSLISFFFRGEFPFEVEDKEIIIEADPTMKKFIEAFSGKFKEILEMDVKVKEKKPEKKVD